MDRCTLGARGPGLAAGVQAAGDARPVGLAGCAAGAGMLRHRPTQPRRSSAARGRPCRPCGWAMRWPWPRDDGRRPPAIFVAGLLAPAGSLGTGLRGARASARRPG